MFIKELERKLKPSQILRLGLGLVFIYAALNMWVTPEKWINAVPVGLNQIIDRYTFLIFYAAFQLILGVLFLTDKLIK